MLERAKTDDGGAMPRWEWCLPGGERVAATIGTTTDTESVVFDGVLVARTSRGAKPEGHLVAKC